MNEKTRKTALLNVLRVLEERKFSSFIKQQREVTRRECENDVTIT